MLPSSEPHLDHLRFLQSSRGVCRCERLARVGKLRQLYSRCSALASLMEPETWESKGLCKQSSHAGLYISKTGTCHFLSLPTLFKTLPSRRVKVPLTATLSLLAHSFTVFTGWEKTDCKQIFALPATLDSVFGRGPLAYIAHYLFAYLFLKHFFLFIHF